MTRTEREQADRQVQTVCLLILALLAVGGALYLLRPVLVPFVLAVFFTYCLSAVIDLLMRRLRMPRWPAILVTGVLGIVILVLFGLLVSNAVARILQNIDTYEEQLRELTHQLTQALPMPLKSSINVDDLFTLPDSVRRSLLPAILGELTDQVSRAGLVVIFVIFLLLGRKGPTPRVGLLGEIEERVMRFVSRIVFLSAGTGLLVWLSLQLLGVKFAMVFGVLAFLLNFIPNVGSAIATVLPVPVILLSPELSVSTKILALVIPAAIQAVGGVIQPKVLGGSLDLHPVALLMALIFFSMIWGPAGAFLAAPTTAVIKIILERYAATRALASVLAGNLEPLSRQVVRGTAVKPAVRALNRGPAGLGGRRS